MPTTRRTRLHVKLAADYFEDDQIIEAGERAELLYVRGLAFCKRYWQADGLITDGQLARTVGAGLTGVNARANRLCAVGLWERVEDDLLGGGRGYRVVAWLKWNPSCAEIETARRADSERKRGKR